MTTIILVRHAAHSLQGRVMVGRMTGVPLSPSGQRQAERLALRLARHPVDAVHCGPLERARATADAIARPFSLPVQVADALDELDFGDWTGHGLDDLDTDPVWQRFNAFRSGTPIPNGETMIAAQARMVAHMVHLRDAWPDGIVVAVGHGDPIRSALAYWLGVPIDLFQRIEVSPASISVVDLTDAGARVLGINEEAPP